MYTNNEKQAIKHESFSSLTILTLLLSLYTIEKLTS